MSRYASVDWAKHDAALARELGVTRVAIGKARRKHTSLPSIAPKRIKKLTNKQWIERASILLADMERWERRSAEDCDLEEEMDLVGEIFEEAAELRKLKP